MSTQGGDLTLNLELNLCWYKGVTSPFVGCWFPSPGSVTIARAVTTAGAVGAGYFFKDNNLEQWFSTVHQGTFAKSGDICGSWDLGRCYCHLVGRGQGGC